jgi:hypothetical protein
MDSIHFATQFLFTSTSFLFFKQPAKVEIHGGAMKRHLSQSSQQIKLMEEIGRPLFMRLGKFVLRREANSLLEYNEGILRDLKNAEVAIRENQLYVARYG